MNKRGYKSMKHLFFLIFILLTYITAPVAWGLTIYLSAKNQEDYMTKNVELGPGPTGQKTSQKHIRFRANDLFTNCDYGGAAQFTLVRETSDAHNLKVSLNGDSKMVFTPKSLTFKKESQYTIHVGNDDGVCSDVILTVERTKDE